VSGHILYTFEDASGALKVLAMLNAPAVCQRAGGRREGASRVVRVPLEGLAVAMGAADLSEAGVPEITAHGMRGLHSTLAVDSGITGHAVAAALGHESFEKTTAESYVRRAPSRTRSSGRSSRCSPGGEIERLSYQKPGFNRFRTVSQPVQNRTGTLKKLIESVELNGIEPSASSMPFRGNRSRNR
jgi:hypothetical protein